MFLDPRDQNMTTLLENKQRKERKSTHCKVWAGIVTLNMPQYIYCQLWGSGEYCSLHIIILW